MTRRSVIAALLVIATCASVALGVAPVNAITPARSSTAFDPGDIISDAAMTDAAAMSEAQVQKFLRRHGAHCTPTFVACLKDYTETTVTRPASTGGQCAAYTGAENEPASRILVKVAAACSISPKVLIVILQKEESLVDAIVPKASNMKIAMGYACPDTAACDIRYYGFYNQVYWAAWQLHEYMLHSYRWHFRVGTFAVRYAPRGPCRVPKVDIRTLATAALYDYTPYQPNAAALKNAPGTGDSCSSYGNRNFWLYYRDWFGAAA